MESGQLREYLVAESDESEEESYKLIIALSFKCYTIRAEKSSRQKSLVATGVYDFAKPLLDLAREYIKYGDLAVPLIEEYWQAYDKDLRVTVTCTSRWPWKRLGQRIWLWAVRDSFRRKGLAIFENY